MNSYTNFQTYNFIFRRLHRIFMIDSFFKAKTTESQKPQVKWANFVYHVGKWFRFGSNSPRPSLGSPLMVWCIEISPSDIIWPFPKRIRLCEQSVYAESPLLLISPPASVVFDMVAHLKVPFRGGQGVVDCRVGEEQKVRLPCLLFCEIEDNGIWI